MAYTYISREEQVGVQVLTQVYLQCSECKSLVSKQPGGDWAAWDHPGIPINSGRLDDRGEPIMTIVLPRKVALCSACYVPVYLVRYPNSNPPRLFDGRVK